MHTQPLKHLHYAVAALCFLPLLAHAAVDLSRFPDADASDPKRLGWMVGTPPTPDKQIRATDRDYLAFPKIRWSASHIRELLPTAQVKRGAGPATPLQRAERALGEVRYRDMDGVERSWDEALAKTWSDGVIVLHRGRIVSEQYFGAGGPLQPHMLMSCTKSFVGLLAAMLVHEGKLDAQAPVVRYLPELAGTAWGDATLRQVMDMTIGLRYSETYADPKAEIWGYAMAAGFLAPPPGVVPANGLVEFFKTLAKEGEHGEAFAYKTPNTDVLGWLIYRVTGKPLSQHFSERFWQPLGTEEDAYLMVDRNGFEVGGGGLNMILRDMARFGEMMRRDGEFNGRRIVPQEVIADIRAGADRAHFAKAGFATLPNWSYRNMWWVSDQGDYMARGIHGQAIYIDPAREITIVRFGSHPMSSNVYADPIILPAYRAVARHLAGK
jgi:CubicO group peptidase (beta-lactamase class C family)